MNEEKIIDLLISRDERAISEIERKYGESLRRLSESITRDRRDAEECVNDAYLALWRTVPDNVPESPQAYLVQTAKNLSYKRVRSKTAQKRSATVYELTEYGLGLADYREPWDEVRSAELREAINGFFDSLSPEDRVIFVRRHLYSDSYADIGYRIGKSEKLVSVRLSRMRERMRAYLCERGVIGLNEYEKKPVRGRARKLEGYTYDGRKYSFTPISMEYRHIVGFSEGLCAVVRGDGRVGFIDESGKLAIPFEYYSHGYNYDDPIGIVFSEGLAEVMNKEGKFGFIDREWRTVIPFEYDAGQELENLFFNGTVGVRKDGEWLTIDKNNRILWTEAEDKNILRDDGTEIFHAGDLIGVVRGGALGYIDREGKTVVPFEYDYEQSRFSEGVLAVRKNGKWGFVDSTGREILEPVLEYDKVMRMSDGLSMVHRGEPGTLPMIPGESELEYRKREADARRRSVRYGFIDITGREVIPSVYEKIFQMEKDVILLVRDGEYSVCNSRGEITKVLTGYDCVDRRRIFDFGTRGLSVEKDGKHGIIDYDGTVLIPPVYDEILCFEKYALLRIGDRWSVCINFGEPLLPFEYEEISAFHSAAIAKKDGVYGVLCIEGIE